MPHQYFIQNLTTQNSDSLQIHWLTCYEFLTATHAFQITSAVQIKSPRTRPGRMERHHTIITWSQNGIELNITLSNVWLTLWSTLLCMFYHLWVSLCPLSVARRHDIAGLDAKINETIVQIVFSPFHSLLWSCSGWSCTELMLVPLGSNDAYGAWLAFIHSRALITASGSEYTLNSGL